MKNEKILIAIITHDRRVDSDTVAGIIDIMSNLPEGCTACVRFYMQNGQAMSRNIACKEAMENGYTRLLFLDSDLAARWDHFERCMESGHDIACGTYAHKDPTKLTLCNNPIVGETEALMDGDFARVQEAGTGFMLIKVPLLDRMIATGKIPNVVKDGTTDLIHSFFQFGALDGRGMSEDWYFCNIAYKLTGERPWVDLKRIIMHVGYVLYPLPQFMPV